MVAHNSALIDDLSYDYGGKIAVQLRRNLYRFEDMVIAGIDRNNVKVGKQGRIILGLAQQLNAWARNYEKGLVKYGNET